MRQRAAMNAWWAVLCGVATVVWFVYMNELVRHGYVTAGIGAAFLGLSSATVGIVAFLKWNKERTSIGNHLGNTGNQD